MTVPIDGCAVAAAPLLPPLTVSLDPITVLHPSDALRLLAVPVLCWAAVRDYRTRRVARAIWPPLIALGLLLLGWDLWTAWTAPFRYEWKQVATRTLLSVGVVAPGGVLMHRLGGFGRADMKAVVTLAVVFPTAPAIVISGGPALPLVDSRIGVFSLTILTNGILLGLAYPLALAAWNLAHGRVSRLAPVGRPVSWDRLEATHGRLLETPRGYTRRGLDLDALRMYLRWRGCRLAGLRTSPRFRDPDTLPRTPERATDGAVRPDGGNDVGSEPTPDDRRTAGDRQPEAERDAMPGSDDGGSTASLASHSDDPDDPWGAAAFLADVGSAYGTAPADLRDGLDLLVERDTVWVSPGMPFLVPLTLGLLVALTYGDLLFGILGGLGLV